MLIIIFVKIFLAWVLLTKYFFLGFNNLLRLIYINNIKYSLKIEARLIFIIFIYIVRIKILVIFFL